MPQTRCLFGRSPPLGRSFIVTLSYAAPQRPPPPHFVWSPSPFHGGGNRKGFSRRGCVRVFVTRSQCQGPKTARARTRGGRSAERRIHDVRRAGARIAPACVQGGARHGARCLRSVSARGARSPSGAPPRLSSGLRPPDSAPGHASWEVGATGVTRALASPVQGKHLPPRSWCRGA